MVGGHQSPILAVHLIKFVVFQDPKVGLLLPVLSTSWSPENGKDLQILFKPLIDLPVGNVLHYKNGDDLGWSIRFTTSNCYLFLNNDTLITTILLCQNPIGIYHDLSSSLELNNHNTHTSSRDNPLELEA